MLLDCRLQLKAGRDESAGLHSERLEIHLTASPMEGKASAYLLAFFDKTLGTAKGLVSLESGELNRQKRVHIRHPIRLPEELGIAAQPA